MGYFKNRMIAEDDVLFWSAERSGAPAARTGDGGDDMNIDDIEALLGMKPATTTVVDAPDAKVILVVDEDPVVREVLETAVPDDVAEGNAFGRFEDQQEQLAYVREMEQEDAQEALARASAGLIEVPPEVAYVHKGVRHQLVFEGVCTHCAHCGHKLKDAESIERGIGPVCSKKGYTEDPKSSAEPMDAMIALSEFPELVAWLNKKYVPGGVRNLVNGLVRTAALNRRTPVHSACTDAVEALGYTTLASLLRESISTVEISEPTDHPGFYEVWVKKSDFSWKWYNDLKVIAGFRTARGAGRIVRNFVPKTGANRVRLAKAIVTHFQGLFVKTPKGATRITPEWFAKAEAAAEKARLAQSAASLLQEEGEGS